MNNQYSDKCIVQKKCSVYNITNTGFLIFIYLGPFYGIMRKGCTLIFNNTANDGASAKASPFHALIVLGKNDCPYWLIIIMFKVQYPISSVD